MREERAETLSGRAGKSHLYGISGQSCLPITPRDFM